MNKEFLLDYTALEQVFTIEKIKEDLYEYYHVPDDGSIEIVAGTDFDDSTKTFVFSRADVFTLSAIRTLKRYTGELYSPYLVDVIIGNYEVGATGILFLEKFRVEVWYNHECSAWTTNQYYTM